MSKTWQDLSQESSEKKNKTGNTSCCFYWSVSQIPSKGGCKKMVQCIAGIRRDSVGRHSPTRAAKTSENRPSQEKISSFKHSLSGAPLLLFSGRLLNFKMLKWKKLSYCFVVGGCFLAYSKDILLSESLSSPRARRMPINPWLNQQQMRKNNWRCQRVNHQIWLVLLRHLISINYPVKCHAVYVYKKIYTYVYKIWTKRK